MSRLDNFAIHLQNNQNARGYIVVYRERNGLLGKYLSYIDFAKEYLASTRGIPSERLTTLGGGYRDNLTTELWIVPQNASLPVAAPVIEPGNTRAARKFDEGFADYLTYQGDRHLWTYDLCGLGAVHLQAFAEQLRSEPDSRGHIIIYTEYGKRPRRSRTMARLIKAEMANEYKIDGRRLVIVYGGRREIPAVELWIVPKGATAPRPSPQIKRIERVNS